MSFEENSTKRAKESSRGLEESFKKLKRNNIMIVGTDHRGRSDYQEIKKFKYEGICVIMGAEDTGISRALKDSCDEMFSIPVFGNVECLNISVASGVMLYEVAKYR